MGPARRALQPCVRWTVLVDGCVRQAFPRAQAIMNVQAAFAARGRETSTAARRDKGQVVFIIPPRSYHAIVTAAPRWSPATATRRRPGPDSRTIRGLLCGACAGWGRPPTSAELYAALRAERLDRRQLSVAGVLINEASFVELVNAHTERVFTWRQTGHAPAGCCMRRAGSRRWRSSRPSTRRGGG